MSVTESRHLFDSGIIMTAPARLQCRCSRSWPGRINTEKNIWPSASHCRRCCGLRYLSARLRDCLDQYRDLQGNQ